MNATRGHCQHQPHRCFFRLNEIVLQKHRPVYLMTNRFPTGTDQDAPEAVTHDRGPGSTFRTYKKLSTLYRLASLLGWVRACRREFSYVRLAPRTDSAPIDSAISKFENALSDGSWVERERVVRLCELWRICGETELSKNPERLKEVGVRIDNAIYDQLEAANLADLSDLDELGREALSRTIASLLVSELRTNPVSEASLRRTWPEGFSIISMREAWIYKDWQSAIGDLMLRELKDEDRKFEVLGYGDFERICISGEGSQKRWIWRLSDILDEVDFSIEDRFDARPRQLRTVARATAELVKALHSAQGSQTIIAASALTVADEVLDRVM
jgi:hypothetical protein